MIPSFLKRNPPPTASPTQSPEKQPTSPDPFWRTSSSNVRYAYQSSPAKTPGSNCELIGHQYPFARLEHGNTPGTRKNGDDVEQPTGVQRTPSQESVLQRQLSVDSTGEEKAPSIKLRLTQQHIERALSHKMALTSAQSESLAVPSVTATALT
eukprot:430522-Rhodomonas_salina.1